MSVMFEYFRAPDRDSALRMLGTSGGDGEDTPTSPTSTTADALGAPGVDSTVTLGQLVALVREVPWDADLVRGDLVWPGEEPEAGETGESEELPDDSPWTSGVTVEELDDDLRDDLAGVHDAELPVLTEQWARIEEFGEEPDLETVGALLAQLVGLARRARDDGDRLYSWCAV